MAFSAQPNVHVMCMLFYFKWCLWRPCGKAPHIRMFVHSLLAGVFPVVKDWLRNLGFLPATREHMRRVLEAGAYTRLRSRST